MTCTNSIGCPGANNWHHDGNCPNGSTCISDLVPGIQIDQNWIYQNITGGNALGGAFSTFPERWQRCVLEDTVGQCVPKSNNLRLHMVNWTMQNLPYILNQPDAFLWSEDFDGMFTKNGYTYLVNFKMVNARGGAQTRTMRELYHFIGTQLNYVQTNPNSQYRFLNILDGDVIVALMSHYHALVNQFPPNVQKSVYVGDSYTLNAQWPLP